MLRCPPESGQVWVPTPAVRASIWFHAASAVALATWPFEWRWLLGAILGNHLLLAGFGMWPRSSLVGENISRVPPGGHDGAFVVLTFDDGPDPAVTPQVLELLRRHGAKASFFCIGERAAAFPHIVADIVRHGHSVENHSHRHPLGFACLSVAAMRRDIARAQAALSGIAGTAPGFFRAPFGIRSPLLDPVLAAFPLRYVSWTRRGYDCASSSPAAILSRLTRGLAAGDILLLHDTATSRTAGGTPVVLDVLPALLQRIEAAGLRALSLPLAMAEPTVARRRA